MKIQQMKNMDGLLPIRKDSGWTSHDVVAKARRLLGQKRIGHAGTLDPDVTGVLVLCVGKATRMVEYVQELPKTYDVQLIFGKSTDTLDLSGTMIESIEDVNISLPQLKNVLAQFEGTIEQVPPMFSAVKVQGKKLYELARQGREIERKARPVRIYNIQLNRYNLEAAFPEIEFTVTCSKGTYIRTLCEDIGKKLSIPAVMGKLVRTQSGPFTIDDCCTLDELENSIAAQQLSQWLKPIDWAVKHFPMYHLHSAAVLKAAQGQKLFESDVMEPVEGLGSYIRLYSPDHQFIGLFERTEERMLQPIKIFATPDLFVTKGIVK